MWSDIACVISHLPFSLWFFSFDAPAHHCQSWDAAILLIGAFDCFFFAMITQIIGSMTAWHVEPHGGQTLKALPEAQRTQGIES